MADCWIELYDTKWNKKIHSDRNIIINKWKKVIFDTFHIRDYIDDNWYWRIKHEKWYIPTKYEIDKIYRDKLIDKELKIACLHIQERHVNEIKKFISWNNSILQYQIKLLKQYIWLEYNKIPVIIELDPIPLSPISQISKWKIMNPAEIYKNTETLKKFIDKVNILRYS